MLAQRANVIMQDVTAEERASNQFAPAPTHRNAVRDHGVAAEPVEFGVT